jgi:hypothetical protein
VVRFLRLLSFAAILLPMAAAHAQVIVRNAPFDPAEILPSTAVVGFRALPPDAFAALPQSQIWIVRPELMYSAGQRSPVLVKETKAKGQTIADLPPHELLASLKSETTNVQFAAQLPTKMKAPPSYDSEKKFDTWIVLSAAAANLIDGRDPLAPQAPGHKFFVNPAFAKTVTGTYATLKELEKSNTPASAQRYAQLVKATRQSPLLDNAAAVDLFRATFARPRFTKAADKKLQVPAALADKFDVYWVDLGFIIANEYGRAVREITFSITLPKDAVALELLPVRASAKAQGAAPAADTSADIFGQKIQFEDLKPAVAANGRQDNTFGWILSERMADRGPKRFVAIVGVPKGTKDVGGELALGIRVDGALAVQNNIASTPPVAFDEVLSR